MIPQQSQPRLPAFSPAPSRRSLLQAGSLGLLGLGLPHLFAAQAAASAAVTASAR